MAVSWSHGDVNDMKIPAEPLFAEKLVKFSREQFFFSIVKRLALKSESS